MNIFATSKCPLESAKALDDKIVTQMNGVWHDHNVKQN